MASYVTTADKLAAKAKDIAQNYKTLYVKGCFGAPLTPANKTRYLNEYSWNRSAERKPMIQSATENTFGFDCNNLIKGILWGWCGDKTKVYGGAVWISNGVPDISEDQMIARCDGVSTAGWKDMAVGEVVWMSGHIGIYIGDGLAVEASPKWENRVQITAVGNIGAKVGYNTRTWTKHGRLPWVDYSGNTKEGYCTVDIKVLKKGAKGDDVRAMQYLLIGNGFSCGDCGADGSFGGATDTAVRAYQEANGLSVDGSCGAKTWAKLLGQ